jgi:hypothetical protein
MTSRPTIDKIFSDWLIQRCLARASSLAEETQYSIAIESPCLVCQPRIALSLATYLNEFDEHSDGSSWLSITDHQLEQLQAHPELRSMLGHENADDEDSAITCLSEQGRVILELPKCHRQTHSNAKVFQVSMSCKEPEEKNHHLWLNAKRIPSETLIPMIASNFLDWASSGGDRRP